MRTFSSPGGSAVPPEVEFRRIPVFSNKLPLRLSYFEQISLWQMDAFLILVMYFVFSGRILEGAG